MAALRPVVIVGGGMAGLSCANALAEAQVPSVVLEAATEPGGRLSTLRIGTATFDAGAQYFTVHSDGFAEMVRQWHRAGLVYEWCRGFDAADETQRDGFPRYAVRWGMSALAKHLAATVGLRLGVRVVGIRPGVTDGFIVDVAGDERAFPRGDKDAPPNVSWSVEASAVVLAIPVTQALELLSDSGVTLDEPHLHALSSIQYAPTLTALVALDSPTAMTHPGAFRPDPAVDPDSPLMIVTDNQAKGISTTPAVTIHASHAWSAEHWDEDDDKNLAQLIEFAAHLFGSARPTEARLVRFRYALPNPIDEARCRLVNPSTGPLVFCGDAFAGPRIEGAVMSGVAAAKGLVTALDLDG